MARAEVPIVVLNGTTGLPVNGASVAITNRPGGTPATWFAVETGGTGSTAAVITDANGRVNAWVERGAYTLSVTGTGITGYSEPWDAVPGGNATIDTAWITDGAVSNAKLATGIDSAKLTTIPGSKLANADVSFTKLVAGPLRILGIVPLVPWSLAANGLDLLSASDVALVHNNRPCYAFLSITGVVGTSAAGINHFVRLDGVDNSVSNQIVSAGAVIGTHRFYAAGTLTGSHNWNAVVTLGNNPTTYVGAGQGTLVVFET